jgi:hypothetical protein
MWIRLVREGTSFSGSSCAILSLCAICSAKCGIVCPICTSSFRTFPDRSGGRHASYRRARSPHRLFSRASCACVPSPHSSPPKVTHPVRMFNHPNPLSGRKSVPLFRTYGRNSARKRKFARSTREPEGTRRWSQPWLRIQGQGPVRSQVSALANTRFE